MTHWEELEEWFYEDMPNGGRFDHADVMERFDFDGETATRYIQSHLNAQRARSSRTLYVIHRDGRTANAVWTVGVRTVDVRGIGHQFFDDVKQRFVGAVAQDLARVAYLNPRAAKRCTRIVEAVGDNAMQLLRIAVDGLQDDEGD